MCIYNNIILLLLLSIYIHDVIIMSIAHDNIIIILYIIHCVPFVLSYQTEYVYFLDLESYDR